MTHVGQELTSRLGFQPPLRTSSSPIERGGRHLPLRLPGFFQIESIAPQLLFGLLWSVISGHLHKSIPVQRELRSTRATCKNRLCRDSVFQTNVCLSELAASLALLEILRWINLE
jgi:hypothetical protein